MGADDEMKMQGDVNDGEGGVDVGDVFQEHLRHFSNSKIASHKHLCAVMSATGEVIKEQGLKPTATAYFAAVMSSLENKAAREDECVLAAMSSLLAMVMPMVPAAVLRTKMAATMTVVTELITSTKESSPAISKTLLSCLGHLLTVADRTQWDTISGAYGLLLQHCVHSRPKVRKKAQNCVAAVLLGLRGCAAHGAASEAIVSLSERLFAEAMAVPGAQEEDDDDERGGRSKSKKKAMAVSSSQAAAEALHLLGAMKQLLPLMSAKAIARASHRMANLCSLQQPMLTRLVANAIKSLSDEVAGKTSLSDDVAGKGKSEVVPDVLAETVVNILELEEEGRIGRKRDPDVIMTILEMVKSTFLDLHDRDRAVCSKKLPQVFNLLAGNLASEQEEVVFGTADCLKLLIVCCIDDEMINEGQMQVGLVAERRKGGLTPIERLSVMVEGLLGYQYASAWETTLVVVSTFLEKLGPASAILAANVVKTLGELQELSDESMPCRQQLHTAIGTAVAAMGPEQFLKILPLEMDNQDLSHSRAWLLPIMKQHVVGARLQFFAEYFLPLSAKLRERARTCAAEGRPVAAKNSEACIVQIWAILPALCNYPSDTARSFRLLAKAIGDALLKEPELRGSICSSLQILINQNKKARGDPGLNNEEDAEEEKVSDADGKPLTAAEERARALHTPEVVSANLAAIGAFARNFLPLLFNVFISLEPEKRAFLQQTIDAFASVADPATIKSFFMSVMEKLVEALKEAASAKTAADGDAAMQVDGESNKAEIATTRRCTFMELAVSLVQGLDDESLHVLYRTARVGIQDSDFSVQKKSYKLLAKMYELKGAFMASLTQDMLEALLASLGVCHSTARRGRLICVQHVVINLIKRKDPQASDALATLISEVILATKENNAKTRITAFDIILNIGKSTEEVGGPDQGGGNLQRFFTMVVGGLAGTTTRMVSCSVMALARLLYEFSTRLSHTVPQLLPTVLLLLRSKSREIVKAVLGFVKVVVMRLPGTELEPHLGTMIEGLTVWSDDTKNHFKAKVRLIFEMLLKRCGYDAIAAVMPEEHMKLLTNIRKSRDRAERHRKEGRSVAGDGAQSMKSRATTARKSSWKHDDVFSDDADDEDETRPRSVCPSARSGARTTRGRPGTIASTRKMRQAKSRLPEDDGDSDGDEPLDLLDASRARKALMAGSHASQKETQEQDDVKYAPDGRMVIDEKEDRKEKKRKRGDVAGEGSDGDEDGASRGGKSSSKWGKKSSKDRAGKHGKKKRAHTGEEYKPQRGAGGDAKGNKKVEPYAYWPLDRKLLNRREGKRVAARKGMAGVMKVKKGKTGMAKRQKIGRK